MTAPARPIWLVTLADLALLLIGFLALAHARGHDPAVARALAARFAAAPAADDPPIAAAAERLAGFAVARADPPADLRPVARWAAEQLRDPRVALTVSGSVDGSAADVDPATRSGELLALDRARAVATAIAPLAPTRVRVAASPLPGRRAVTVTLGFAGERTRP